MYSYLLNQFLLYFKNGIEFTESLRFVTGIALEVNQFSKRIIISYVSPRNKRYTKLRQIRIGN